MISSLQWLLLGYLVSGGSQNKTIRIRGLVDITGIFCAVDRCCYSTRLVKKALVRCGFAIVLTRASCVLSSGFIFTFLILAFPTGIEPARPVPETGALSTELRERLLFYYHSIFVKLAQPLWPTQLLEYRPHSQLQRDVQSLLATVPGCLESHPSSPLHIIIQLPHVRENSHRLEVCPRAHSRAGKIHPGYSFHLFPYVGVAYMLQARLVTAPPDAPPPVP